MTALAVTAPFVIRLLARAEHIGITAGKVYALSTAGSIGGILITAFYLIPRLGTRMTLQILCASTLLVGAFGLIGRTAAAAAFSWRPLARSFSPSSPIRRRSLDHRIRL